MVKQRIPHGHLVAEKGLATSRDVAGQEPQREGVMVEHIFPSSLIVVEQRFLHGHSVAEQGLATSRDVSGQDSSREGIIVEQRFPS